MFITRKHISRRMFLRSSVGVGLCDRALAVLTAVAGTVEVAVSSLRKRRIGIFAVTYAKAGQSSKCYGGRRRGLCCASGG